MTMFKIATWNVNSIRIRLAQVLAWLAQERPDVLALQETKGADFPTAPFVEMGYAVSSAGQKAYNGVALLSRVPGLDLATALPGLPDPQRRLLSARYGGLTVVNVYVPNGSELGSDKYRYKLAWLAALQDHLGALLAARTPLIALGDFNIAPDDRDVHDPASWEGGVLVSPEERGALRRLLDGGLTDTFRLFDQDPQAYSWWDYRAGAFRRNHGLRIDLILASAPLAEVCKGCRIDRDPRRHPQPSDHTPVVAEFALDQLDQ
jgi:exodeoxyribonuclease-3